MNRPTFGVDSSDRRQEDEEDRDGKAVTQNLKDDDDDAQG